MADRPAVLSNDRGLVRELNVWHASALVVGIIIGSGIFLVPYSMMRNAGTVELVLAAWVVGGILSWAGSVTVAELSAMKPTSGGEYVYIRDAYGPMLGFLYAWNTFLIAKPASIATVAAGFVRIVGQFPHLEFLNLPIWSTGLQISLGQVAACGIILFFSIVNFLGVRKAGNIQLITTILKVVMILVIVVICLSSSGGGTANLKGSYPDAVGGFTGFMAALIGALWAFDGWNNVIMVAGEVKEPQRNLPRALIFGIFTVGALYILTYLAIQWVLPASELAHSERPAAAAIQRVMGDLGGWVISAGIAFSMFVTINGQILAGARVPFAAAQDGSFFPGLAQVHARYRTPANSIWFQCVLTMVLLVVGGKFEDLFNLAIFSEWLFYMLSVGSVFVFRKREPDAPRPYRVIGYPVVPALFILAATVLLYSSFTQNLKNSVVGLLVILAGIPVFLYFRGRMSAAR